VQKFSNWASHMPNVRLVIEYNGAAFHGWQIQPGLRTVQESLHNVLELVLHEKIRVVHASGRTDSGVHARRQVVTFFVQGSPDLHRLTHSVSSLLKNRLSVVEADIAPDDFHPRRDALQKQYVYHILNRPAPPVHEFGKVWHITSQLNVKLMKAEAETLVGVHDFTSFRASECQARSPVKEIFESEIVQDGQSIVYRVVGKGFLKQMVRILVGTLVDLGKGKMTDMTMLEVLNFKDRQRAGVTAPPQGLFLDWVKYCPDRYFGSGSNKG
jgi:tRNA pseudouridine38-40 synthase